MSLIVSNRQLTAISGVLEDRENVLLLDYAMKRFPDIVVPRSEECSIDWIRAARTRAGRFDIRQGRNLAVFIDLTIMYGPGFETSDWAAETLRSKTFSEFQKINILKDKLEDQGIAI